MHDYLATKDDPLSLRTPKTADGVQLDRREDEARVIPVRTRGDGIGEKDLQGRHAIAELVLEVLQPLEDGLHFIWGEMGFIDTARVDGAEGVGLRPVRGRTGSHEKKGYALLLCGLSYLHNQIR